jgi:hypothetical protein
MTHITKIQLQINQFSENETIFVENGELTASLFRYSSGVCAVRLKNSLGELVLLPYQGQQIWDASMRGRRLTMRSMFDQPQPTRDFLSTYGAFLVHCGATAMGVPGQEDTHPLHGDLPNASYQSATVVCGSDEKGDYIGLTGVYQHTIAFSFNYLATPIVKLYASSSVFSVSMNIQNLKSTPMPLMFLEHVNFLPINGGQLAQSVLCDPENMKVRASIPDFMEVPPGYRQLVKLIQRQPEKHLVFDPALVYDPELVLYMNYRSDKSGWAHTMQIHPDGTSDVLSHRPEQLNHGVRWICRTGDYDAIGIEPCTAEVEGFQAEKRKGNVRYLAAVESFLSELEIGALTQEETSQEIQVISEIVSGGI